MRCSLVDLRCHGSSMRRFQVSAGARPKFARGVKLRHEPDGNAMLLVPEGALELNTTAAAALELIDGRRTVDEIVDAIVQRFDVSRHQAHDDLTDLFGRLKERGFVILRQAQD